MFLSDNAKLAPKFDVDHLRICHNFAFGSCDHLIGEREQTTNLRFAMFEKFVARKAYDYVDCRTIRLINDCLFTKESSLTEKIFNAFIKGSC